MKAAKWGNSWRFEFPRRGRKARDLAERRTRAQDNREISFEVTRNRRRRDAIEAIRKLAVPLPEGYKFNREELYDRFDNSVLEKQCGNSAGIEQGR